MEVEDYIQQHRNLYEIYQSLFSLTFNSPLSCLNYYEEDDGLLLAEIKGTEFLSIEERLIKHKTLLEKVKTGSNLEYSKEPVCLIVDEEKEQLNLFAVFGDTQIL